jgi:Ca2+-binding EF-hand superfamily protein
MGNTNDKKSSINNKVKAIANVNKRFSLCKNKDLTENDYNYLTKQTNVSREEIKLFYEQFHANNPGGILNQKDFIKLYCKLRSEPEEVLNRISEFVFQAFDNDKNGKL